MRKTLIHSFFFIYSFSNAQVTTNDPNKVYGVTEVDSQPSFPGGNDSMYTFLKKNLHYPDSAKALGIQGKVFIQFTVSKAGKVGNIKILKGVEGCKACDEQAVSVVKMFPRWRPSEIKGKKVNVQYVLPINFKLKPDLDKIIYKMSEVEWPASFPGGDSALYRFMGKHLNFADSSYKRNKDAVTYISFIVKRTGEITDIQTIKDSTDCPECDLVVENMVKQFPSWIPAQKGKENVNERVLFPVDYYLYPERLKMKKDTASHIYDFERYAEFPGGDIGLLDYFRKSLIYPEKEKEDGIQGKVFVGFVIEKDGTIQDIHVIKGVEKGAALEAEAIRLIKGMPKWIPAAQNGKAVRVKYSVPINFRLG